MKKHKNLIIIQSYEEVAFLIHKIKSINKNIDLIIANFGSNDLQKHLTRIFANNLRLKILDYSKFSKIKYPFIKNINLNST